MPALVDDSVNVDSDGVSDDEGGARDSKAVISG